jgi:hypothetical protein
VEARVKLAVRVEEECPADACPARCGVVLWALAKCRIRRFVCWLSVTFAEDLGLVLVSVCGFTCAAQIAGANNNPLTTTNRRIGRVPCVNIFCVFPDC